MALKRLFAMFDDNGKPTAPVTDPDEVLKRCTLLMRRAKTIMRKDDDSLAGFVEDAAEAAAAIAVMRAALDDAQAALQMAVESSDVDLLQREFKAADRFHVGQPITDLYSLSYTVCVNRTRARGELVSG